MNQPDTFDERDDDAALESLLSPLKRIEPPDAARAEFRAAVAAELGSIPPIRTRTPWWRRTIAVPVPVAVSAAVLLCASIGWSISRSSAVGRGAVDSPPRVTPVAPVPSLPAPWGLAELRPVAPSAEVEHFSTQIYVCGVGPVKSTSGYIVRE
jgi:hypothetical protein